MPEIGQRFRLREHVGYDPVKAAGDDGRLHSVGLSHTSSLHPLLAGWEGEVVAVVPAGEAGAGRVEEEAVVLSFPHHTYDFSDPRNPVATPHESWTRNVSFTAEQLADLFEEAD